MAYEQIGVGGFASVSPIYLLNPDGVVLLNPDGSPLLAGDGMP